MVICDCDVICVCGVRFLDCCDFSLVIVFLIVLVCFVVGLQLFGLGCFVRLIIVLVIFIYFNVEL